MSYLFKAALLLAVVPLGLAQEETLYDCERDIRPNEADCRAIVGNTGWEGDYINYVPSSPVGSCTVLYGQADENCQLEICYKEDVSVTRGLAYTSWNQVINQCLAKYESGGSLHQNGFDANVVLNQFYEPPALTFDATNETGASLDVKRDAAVQVTRSNSMRTTKRQSPEDTSFDIELTAAGVRNPAVRRQIGGIWSSQASYTTTQTDGFEQGITTTASFEASYFGFFTASASLSIDERYTQSTSWGETVVVNCPGEGVIYAYPAFNLYKGYYRPSNTPADWYVPIEGRTNYDVVCLN